MTRRVHYHATGSSGLSFPCYGKELQARLDSPRRPMKRPDGTVLPVEHYGRPSLPDPRRHSDLRHVTCRDCWSIIAKMARSILKGDTP